MINRYEKVNNKINNRGKKLHFQMNPQLCKIINIKLNAYFLTEYTFRRLKYYKNFNNRHLYISNAIILL